MKKLTFMIFMLSFASASAEAKRFVIPQAVFGGDWQTVLGITNLNGVEPVEVNLRLFESATNQLLAETAVTLAPLSNVKYDIRRASSQPGPGFIILDYDGTIAATTRFQGWQNFAICKDILSFSQASICVDPQWSPDLVTLSHPFESVGVILNESIRTSAAFAVDVLQDVRHRTGVAMVPHLIENGKTYSVGATLYNSDGTVHSEATIDFNGHYSGFVDEIFAGVPQNFRGWMLVRHEGNPVDAIAMLLQSRPGDFELTALSVTGVN